MNEYKPVTQNEKVLAALAHGSVLLGFFTNGVGGIFSALIIWITQKEKSAYVAFQALQALVYQVVVLVVTMSIWACWGMSWIALLFPAISDSGAYQTAPPPGIWIGLSLMCCPLGLMALTVGYGLVAAARTLSGHPFRYVLIGDWLQRRSDAPAAARVDLPPAAPPAPDLPPAPPEPDLPPAPPDLDLPPSPADTDTDR